MRKRGRQRRVIDAFGGARLLCRRSIDAQRKQALNRPLHEDEERTLILPARVSMAALLEGKALVGDLHNIAAFLNVGMVLAHDIKEFAAQAAIQAGIFAVSEVKHRPGPRYAMNADQRALISEAVALTDEVFTASTLLELSVAHRKVMNAIPQSGTLELREVEVAD